MFARWLLATLLIGACAAPPPKAPPSSEQPPEQALSEADAELFLQTGDVLGAAAVYGELAEAAAPPERFDYLLEAVARGLHRGRQLGRGRGGDGG